MKKAENIYLTRNSNHNVALTKVWRLAMAMLRKPDISLENDKLLSLYKGHGQKLE